MSALASLNKFNRWLCRWVCGQEWANRHEVSLLLLTLLLFLRIPNLSEPYWYGDEGIYLTIGTGLRQGLRLYADIVDHKTPIIYWLAMTPGQLWFRLLLLGWMAAATLFFYQALRRLVTEKLAIAASILFVVLTSLPALEGNIPNGELFVIGFLSVALWLVAVSREAHPPRQVWLVVGAGAVAGLGILTKVPALLDAGALASLCWFWAVAKKRFQWRQLLPIIWFGLGTALTLGASVAYFAWRGTLADYLQFGLLYNLHYSQNWQLPFANPVLVWLFSLPGKAVILLAVFGVLSALVRWGKISVLTAWSAFWLTATLFAALLSNRPYPHYVLQLVPPLSLSAVLLFQPAVKRTERITTLLVWLLAAAALWLLQFRPYPLMEYYFRFWNYSAGRISRLEYFGTFDRLTVQNDQLAPTIVSDTLPSDRIFIWGTNPMLYALTRRAPATRFTVAFHIHDLQAYESTLEELRRNKPAYIVIMKKEPPLAGLDELIQRDYFLVETTSEMVLFRRSNAKSQLLLQ